MYKNQLQEYAQRSCINLPSYSCIREGPDHAPRFKAKVNCNGEVFESPDFCFTLRQAEHAAAEVALKMLSMRGPSRAVAARVMDETGIYKNLLQETTHRAGLKLPVYTTIRTGPGYAPVFTCTVELAGMSFTGEPAKTKKQAQKSAAMAAWFSLKGVSEACSSSFTLSDHGGKDEQVQVIVARYLSSISLTETRNSGQRERGKLEKGLLPTERNMIPWSVRPSYRMPDLKSPHSYFTPEWVTFETFHQGIPPQQSHFLSLPSTSTSIPRPRLFPFFQSIFRPDIGSIFWASGGEPVATVPEIGPFFYLSNNSLPLPYRSDSHVTIEEIEENSAVREGLLNKDVKLLRWRDNVLSGVSGNPNLGASYDSPNLGASSDPQQCSSSASLGSKSPMWETGNEKGLSTNDVRVSIQRSHQDKDFSWLRPGFICNIPLVAEGRESVLHLQSNVANSPPRHSRDLVHVSTVPRVTPRTDGPFPSSGLPPHIPNRCTPVSTPRRKGVATRPSLGDMKHVRPRACTSQMAPAVQIRSVVPVCSSPVRSLPSPGGDGASSQGEKHIAEASGNNVSTASSEFRRLQL